MVKTFKLQACLGLLLILFLRYREMPTYPVGTLRLTLRCKRIT